jgi:hypothetical protein
MRITTFTIVLALATVLSLTLYKIGMIYAVMYCLHHKGATLTH